MLLVAAAWCSLSDYVVLAAGAALLNGMVPFLAWVVGFVLPLARHCSFVTAGAAAFSFSFGLTVWLAMPCYFASLLLVRPYWFCCR